MKRLSIFLYCLLIAFVSKLSYSKTNQNLYIKVFPSMDKQIEHIVVDSISEKPVNTKIIEIRGKKSRLGYVREISTTTGCNSSCLPVIYTAFYDKAGQFIKVLSAEGLTKIYHAPFTEKDYSKLNLLVSFPASSIVSVDNPKDLTDALSGETFKKFKEFVVDGAAYTTLRVILYDIQTRGEILKLLKK